MGRCVTKQPNGNYAIFSSIVDDFVLLDATKDELLKAVMDEAASRAKEDYTQILDELDGKVPSRRGDRDSFKDCLKTVERVHGKRKASRRTKYEFDPE